MCPMFLFAKILKKGIRYQGIGKKIVPLHSLFQEYDYEKFKYSKVTIDARRAYHRGTTWHHSPAIR